MSAVTPIKSVATTYAKLVDTADGRADIGRAASGGYGSVKREQFYADMAELCRLAKITERLIAEGRLR